MVNALLIVHLVLVVFLVGIVLLQRSEGGALGMGGGGGGGGVMTGRSATSALQRATWYLAIGFIATSMTLTILASSNRSGSSVFDTYVPPVQTLSEDADAPLTFTPPTIEGDDAPAIAPATPTTGGSAPVEADPDNLVPVVPAQ